MTRHAINFIRDFVRDAAYGAPLVGPLIRRGVEKIRREPEHEKPEYWDQALASWASPYLGGTIQIDTRNAVTAALIRHIAPHAQSILDIGCAGGTLAFSVERCRRYFGVDISHVAISEARKSIASRKDGPTEMDFAVSGLEAFQTTEKFDIIVFNEVLYYLKLESIEREINRYVHFPSPDGLMIVSLKNDVLSRMIHKLLCNHHDCIYGIIFQLQPKSPSFKITYGRETPAILTCVFRPGGKSHS
jgi:2-polyprenyl-3-methyl-5-hydroxy-6-metoxy-1,4-benzoquinol methylase